MLQPDVVRPAASPFGNILSRALDESAEEEKTHYPVLRAVLSGHGPESVCGAWISKDTIAATSGWHKNRIFISEVFRLEELAFELITLGLHGVFFRDMEIGELNVEELRFRAAASGLSLPMNALPCYQQLTDTHSAAR